MLWDYFMWLLPNFDALTGWHLKTRRPFRSRQVIRATQNKAAARDLVQP